MDHHLYERLQTTHKQIYDKKNDCRSKHGLQKERLAAAEKTRGSHWYVLSVVAFQRCVELFRICYVGGDWSSLNIA